MKKFNKKAVALLLAILLVMAVVPTSFAGEGTPRLVVKTDSDYYKAGDVFTAEVWVYDSTFNTVAFCLGFDSDVVALYDSENETTEDTDYYTSVIVPHAKSGNKGIFAEPASIAPELGVDEVEGIVSAVLFVAPTAKLSDIVITEGTNRLAKVGADGLCIAQVTFKAIADGAPALKFTPRSGDADFNTTGAKLEGPVTSGMVAEEVPEETPYADAQEFIAAVEAIGEVALDDKEAVADAKAKYEALGDTAKEIAKDAKTKLDAAEVTLKALEEAAAKEAADKAAAQVVIDAINAIGEVTLEKEATIEAAREAFDNLTDDQKVYVSNIETLENAETKLGAIKADHAAADEVKAKIEAIGEVKLASEETIKAARTAYDDLTDARKALVTNLDKLEAAEAKLAELKAQVDDVISKIDALPETITPDDADKVAAAKAAYEALNDEQKAAVTNYAELTAAEAAIADYVAAAAVDAKIAALGEVGLADKAKVQEARTAYEALTDAQKALVEKLAVLEDAENAIAKIEADMAAAKAVDDKITALGQVGIADKAKVQQARDAYEALTADQKALVEKLAVLEDAENAIAKIEADMAAAKAVDDKIEAIGDVTLSDEEAIKAARDAYDVLTDDQKAFVTKLSVLEASEKELADLKAAKEVIDKIAALPADVKPEDADAVAAARLAYDALTDAQKAKVINYTKLTAAEEAIKDYVEAAKVDALIAALPATVTLENKEAVEEARTAYEALTDAQKALVEKLAVLEAAEKAIEKIESDMAAAKAVDDKIEAIGEVKLASEAAITEARTAYEALTEDQKAYAEKLEVLEDAEAKLAELKAEVKAVVDAIDALPADVKPEDADAVAAARLAYDALNDEQKAAVTNYAELTAAEEAIKDYVEAAKVDALIAALPATVTLENKEAVEEARTAYEALTDAQKALVEKLAVLEAAEKAIEKIESDMAAAKAVDDKIEAIGEVKLASEAAITEARTAYDALTEDQKAYAEKLEVLEDAEAKLAELKAEVKAVVDAIDALPETITPEDTEAVVAAREAYDALTEEQQALVTNIDKLEAAENLLADYIAAKEVEDMITELPEEGTFVDQEDIEAAKEAYDALTEEQKALVPNAEKVEELLADIEEKQAIVDDYLALYGDKILYIEDTTGYLGITTTIEDLLTAEDKDAIAEGQIVVYSVVGVSEELSDDVKPDEIGALEGEKAFPDVYSVLVLRAFAEMDETQEFVVNEDAWEEVFDIPGTITVEFTVPEDMLISSEQTTRTFSALVEEYGAEEVVRGEDIDENANTMTFVFNASAAFLPLYLDTTNPVTGDSIMIYAVTLMFIVMTAVVINRRNSAKKAR